MRRRWSFKDVSRACVSLAYVHEMRNRAPSPLWPGCLTLERVENGVDDEYFVRRKIWEDAGVRITAPDVVTEPRHGKKREPSDASYFEFWAVAL